MNTAERIIKPTEAKVFRTVFLYTGQGETTLMVIPTGPNVDNYKYVLIDSDQDYEPKEINLIDLFKDLFANSGELSAFINTHPHKDHFGGIKKLYDEIGFDEVWHSNHKPGGEHKDANKDFEYVLKQVGKDNEYHLKGTNDNNKIRTIGDDEVTKKLGLIDYVVLSPAEYLCDEIDDEQADDRYKRIHEQCGVMKFTYGSTPKSIIITGDSDKEAWKEHITDYHKDKLPADVLSASHHGSRTFFKDSEEDEDVYKDHMDAIQPTYVIISAPKQADSKHDHPHDDAIELYEEYVDKDNILHLGKNYECVIVDIKDDGTLSVNVDKELVEEYGKKDDNDDGNKNEAAKINVAIQTSRIDNKPMGLL